MSIKPWVRYSLLTLVLAASAGSGMLPDSDIARFYKAIRAPKIIDSLMSDDQETRCQEDSQYLEQDGQQYQYEGQRTGHIPPCEFHSVVQDAEIFDSNSPHLDRPSIMMTYKFPWVLWKSKDSFPEELGGKSDYTNYTLSSECHRALYVYDTGVLLDLSWAGWSK